jgi:hypothetical protein
MRLPRFARICSCSLAVVAVVLAARASAEPVQTSLTVDANTAGLWLFKEGTGTTSVCEVSGVPAATLNGASWVMGRQYYAVATDSGYVSIPDNTAVRPANAFTAEVWVKLQRPGGYVLCKNGSYLLTVDSSVSASFSVGKGWQAVNGVLPVPMGQWTHIAITYDSATTQAAIYVNGALDTKSTLTGGGKLLVYSSQLRLGLNDWNPMGSEMDGKVDSLRISSVARTFEPIPQPIHEAATPKGNLVPNGDFELGLTGWRMSGEGDANLVWGTDTKDPASGRLCLHNIPGSEGGAALLSRPIPVKPGGHYTFSARIRAGGRNYPRIEVVSAGARGGFAAVPPFPLYPTVDTKWVEVKQSFVIPNDFAAPAVCISLPFTSPGELWVDDVRLMAGETSSELALKDKIAVGPQTLPVGNLYPYTVGSTTPTTLNVVNTDTAAHKVTVQAIAADCEGQPLPAVAVGTFDVPAGGVKTATFGLNTGRRGTFRLGFDLTCEGQTWRQSAECKYAVVVPLKGVGNAEDSAFAMNTHMEREPTPHLSRSMEVLSQCGVKWIRAWWGWGMCEKTQGTFDFTEFDRQFNTVTTGTGMRIMPILLRYYSEHEQKWAGPVTPGAIQEYPDPKVLPEWKVFCGKVAERYKGRITAYELWNEPTMGSYPNGVLTPQQYADLLNNTTPAIRQYDPKAKIVGFAGVPLDYLKNTLKLGVAPLMDVVAEHSYSQLALPEINLPKQTKEVRAILAANGGDKPLWHTEQGLTGDDDGYSPMTISEADVASLYTRNLVLVRSLGIKKYFWFSAQTSPTYGMAIYYENYIPRPRLAALNACASFLEGSSCRESYRPSENAYAFLFERTAPVGVVWNMNAPARVSLSMRPDAVQAFDMMGNALLVVAEKDSAVIQIPAERPAFLRCGAGDSALLKKAVAGMQVKDLDPVVITASPVVGGVQVTLTGASSSPVDGVLDLIPAASKTPTGWPTAQRFQSLTLGKSQTFRFTLPNTAAVSQVRVVCGNRRLQTVTVRYSGGWPPVE